MSTNTEQQQSLYDRAREWTYATEARVRAVNRESITEIFDTNQKADHKL